MVDFSALTSALDLMFSGMGPWIFVIPGLLIGLIFGAVPGLQVSMAMALFLPLTFTMDFIQSIMFLTSIFTGGVYGGGVTAILMNIPGSSSSVATAFDGYPMACNGRQNEALGLSLGASVIGAFIGYVVLFLLIQPLAVVVLKLGPLEMVLVIAWGLTLIAALSGGSMAKGLFAGMLGLILSQVGMSTTGVLRATFGSSYLLDGVQVVPAMIGIFAASELLRIRERQTLSTRDDVPPVAFRPIIRAMLSTFKYPSVLLRGSAIGVLIGAVPGVGSSVANLVAYGEVRRTSSRTEEFGTGLPEGVIAAESANSSSEGGSMAALLALGIPGGAATAVLMAAFSFHNIVGGPAFIRDQGDLVYAIIVGNLVQVLLLGIVGLLVLRLLGMVIKVPLRYLVPSVLALCAWGGFGVTGTIAGVLTVAVFACLGWLMRRHSYPVAATVIGLLLGRMAEGEMVRSLQISGGHLGSYLLERPISMLLLAMMVFSIVAAVLKARYARRAALSPDTQE